MREEINGVETLKMEEINEIESRFFQKINNTDKF